VNEVGLARFSVSVVALAALAAAQTPQDEAPAPQLLDIIKQGSLRTFEREEYFEVHVHSGFKLELAQQQLEIRGGNALLLLDRDAWHESRTAKPGTGLPRRGLAQPDPRRRLSNEQIRARLESTLGSLGRGGGVPESPTIDKALDLLRYIYCEGGVVVVRQGVEVIRCDRLWISPLDDRVVAENVELRYLAGPAQPGQMMVVRAPRLTKQGRRWVGRDVTQLHGRRGACRSGDRRCRDHRARTRVRDRVARCHGADRRNLVAAVAEHARVHRQPERVPAETRPRRLQQSPRHPGPGRFRPDLEWRRWRPARVVDRPASERVPR
jgi:hypothetical protein